MSISKDKYLFKDKTWYIVPWTTLDTYMPSVSNLPTVLVHDVAGYYPHMVMCWDYSDLDGDNSCSICGEVPSEKIQTLWTLQNIDNYIFMSGV